MNLEDEDKTELRKVPTKSILKNRPVQIATESPAPLNEENSDYLIKFQNRRVSFANKVKLHQIDFVPVSGENSLTRSADVSASSDLDDQDDSFLNIEEDTDAIVDAITELEPSVPLVDSHKGEVQSQLGEQQNDTPEVAHPEENRDFDDTNVLNGSHLERNDASNTEEDMELTAPISMPFANSHDFQNKINRAEASAISEVRANTPPPGLDPKDTFDVQATSTQNETTDTQAAGTQSEAINESHQNTSEGHSLLSDIVEEPDTQEGEPLVADQQDEITMDLTSNAPFVSDAQISGPTNEEITSVRSTVHLNEQEQTEEITMEITKTFEAIEPIVETKSTEFETAELPDSSDFEEDVPMELTQPIISSKISEDGVAVSSEQPSSSKTTQKLEVDADIPKASEAVAEIPFSEAQTTVQPQSALNLQPEYIESQNLHSKAETGEEISEEIATGPIPDTANMPGSLDITGYEILSKEDNLEEASRALPDANALGQTSPNKSTNAADSPSTTAANEKSPESFYLGANIHDQTKNPNMVTNGTELKRKVEPPEENAQKRFHWETQVTTSTIPLADVSNTSWDGHNDWEDSVPHFSLTEFLKEIGIKFYDDLEFSTDLPTKHRLSLSDPNEEHTKEDYYRANIQLPLLEVYGLSCKELIGKIQQGKMLFDELQEKTLTDNPDLFKQYYRASYYDQMGMKARFHLLKEYTRQQAKLIWYEWRSKLIANILEVLQNNLEVLQSDKATLLLNISILDEVYDEIKQKFQSLRLEVQQFKEIQERFKNLNGDQIKKIKLHLTELNTRLIEHKEKIAVKERELEQLRDRIAIRLGEVKMVKKALAISETRLNNTKHFNTTEIEGLEYRSQLLQMGSGLRFVKNISQHVDEFEFNSELGLKIDFSKPDSPESTTFYLLESPDSRSLYNKDLLQLCCSDLVEATGFTNVFDSVIKLREKWIKLTEIDRDIYKTSLKYPTKILKSQKREIIFEFQYFSFKDNLKAQVSASVPVQTILQYPLTLQISIKTLRNSNSVSSHSFDNLKKEIEIALPDSISYSLAEAVEG